VPKGKYKELRGIYCLGLFSCATQHSSPRFCIRCDSLQKEDTELSSLFWNHILRQF